MQKNNKNKEWWQHNFNEDYLTSYVDIITPAATKQQLSFIIKNVPLKRGASVLDLACGHGRITFGLTEGGYKMVGLDYSDHFIKLAKAKAEEKGLTVPFVRGDMRRIPFSNHFDAIVNIYTSFGYFETEKENVKTLKSAYAALKKGGYFLMDLNNTLRTVMYFSKLGGTDKKTGFLKGVEQEKLSNGLTVQTTYRFDPKNMRAHVQDVWKKDGKVSRRNTSVRGYTFPEIEKLLAENGFEVKGLWGGFKGEAFKFDSRRMIILARKK